MLYVCLWFLYLIGWHNWPYQRYDKGADDKRDDIERQTDFDVVRKTIPSNALHEQVRLIANRCAECGGRCNANADEEGHGVDT